MTKQSKVAMGYAEKLVYSKNQFIRICLQDLVDREQLHFVVDIQEAA